MSSFRNMNHYSVPVVINGSRKVIKPGQVISGPDNLESIPGIAKIGDVVKAIRPTSELSQSYTMQSKHIPVPHNNLFRTKEMTDGSTTNLGVLVNSEYLYMKNMKELKDSPSVTIAILTKNFLNLIKDCCTSIINVVQYKNVTIMICDTGTVEAKVREYYKELEQGCIKKGWKYKFIQLPLYNFGKNYNDVMKNISTEYVIIQNNDTIAINDYVSEMMNIGIIKKVGSVGCRMFYPQGIIQHDGQTIYNNPGGMIGSPNHHNIKKRKEQVPLSESVTKLVDGNTAACVLMRTQDFKNVGGFDESFVDIYQDVDLMVRIPRMMGKYNYCNRNALITHIDNASRLGGLLTKSRHVEMLRDVRYLMTKIQRNNWTMVKNPKETDFSIITLVHNLDSYKEFLENLKNQLGNHSVELIGIPNFYNQFTSAYKAFNCGIDVASGKHLILCHDDLLIPNDWLQRIKARISEFYTKGINWGVIGPAGIFNNKAAFFLYDKNNKPLKYSNPTIINDQSYYEVESLDELCLIIDKAYGLRFSDDALSGFHFYGANLCYLANSKHLKNFAIDAYCHHKSNGNKNVSTKESYKQYEECANSFNKWTKSHNIKNWRTTTAQAINGNITFFIKPPENSS